MKYLIAYALLFITNSFGIELMKGGGIEASYPFIANLNLDEAAFTESSDPSSGEMIGAAGIHLGITGLGVHLGPIIPIGERNGFTGSLTTSLFWMNVPGYAKQAIYNGISFGFLHAFGNSNVSVPLKFSMGFMKRYWFEEGVSMSGAIGVSI